MRKFLLLSTALTLGALNPALAGGPVVVAEEEMPVVTKKPASSVGFLIPLLILAAVVAVASGDDDEVVDPRSDIRLKEDIVRVGTNHLGLGLYRYRYRGMNGVWEGVMAHEVQVLHPTAVKTRIGGYKSVNYRQLGLELKRVA